MNLASNSFAKGQRGVALVTAILMVAIATTLAAKIAWDNQVSMRRTESTLNLEQAKQLAFGAEAVAISVLLDQGKDFGNYLQDIEEPLTYEAMIEEQSLGLIQGRLLDAQGRLNINNLVYNGAVQEDVKEQFRALLNFLSIDGALVDMMIDWIDSDTVPHGGGAEDGAYTSLDPPYRTANNYLLDISELRSIGGLDRDTYALLQPHLTAIPPGWCGNSGVAKVNLNFASPEVIAAITGISPDRAAEMVLRRDEVPWESIEDVGLPQDLGENAHNYISVRTECFALSVTANVGSSTLTMYSLLDRASTTGQIVARVRAFGLEN